MPASFASSTESESDGRNQTQHACGEARSSSDWLMGMAAGGEEVYTVGYDGRASVVCKKTLRVKRNLEHGKPILCVTYHIGRLLTGDSEGNLTIWDSSLKEKLNTIHLGKTTSLTAWDGKAYASSGKALHCVDIIKGTVEAKAATPSNNNHITVEEGVLYAGGDGMDVRSFSTERLRNLRTYKGMASSVISVAAGKTLVAAGGYDGQVKAWSLSTGCIALSLKAHSDVVSTLAFTSTGYELWSGSGDGLIRSWELHTGRCGATLDAKAGVTSVTLAEQEGAVISTDKSGMVKSFLVRPSAGVASTASDTSAPACTMACRKAAAREYEQAQAGFQQQIVEMQYAFATKLDVVMSDKARLADENRHLNEVIKKLTLENQRLLNSFHAAPGSSAGDADDVRTHDGLSDLEMEAEIA